MNETSNNLTENLQSTGADSQSPVKKPVRGRGRPKGSSYNVQNLTPFTSETAKAISAKANAAKKARSDLRRRLLAAAWEVGLDRVFMEALKNRDENAMNIVEKAARLVGTDFASSEDAVQKVNVKAETNANVKADTTLHVTIEDATKD